MQIEILSVNVSTKPTANGSYQVAEVAYKDLGKNKVSGYKAMSFKNPNVFNRLTSAKAGEKFEINLTKDGNFWQWTDIKDFTGVVNVQNETPASAPRSFSTPKSTYETPEERAARNRAITRMACLERAITLLVANKGKDPIPVEAVEELSQRFVNWVNAGVAIDAIKEMADDPVD